MHRLFALLFAFLFVAITSAACDGGGGSTGAGGDPNLGGVVVGITSDLRVGVDVDRLRVVVRAGDEVVHDELLTAPNAGAGGKLAFPTEFAVSGRASGEVISVEIDAFRPGDATMPLVQRIASTEVIVGKTLLLRVHVDSRCVVAPGSSAPTCEAPETCIAGACSGSAVDPSTLPPYSPSWSKASNDPCKPGGAAEVIVGEGQADYLPMEDHAEAQVEAGPQGGHHIWVAIRVKNLLRSGSITAVTGRVDELDLDIGPFQVIFTLDQDEGGYCKLYGLRFQIDGDEAPVEELLGKVMKVTVKVTDKDGDVGVGERFVTLSKDIL